MARGIAQGASILLLDEPFAGVDKRSEATITRLLRELADDVVVLEAGRIVESGRTVDVLGAPQADATRRLVDATLRNVPDARESARLRAAHDGRLATLTVHDPREFGRVLARMSAHGVEPEIVHGGLTPLKDDTLTTLTLALRGDDAAVTTVLDELRLAADVEEVAA